MEVAISVQIYWDLEKDGYKEIGPRIAKLCTAFRKAFPHSKLSGFNSLQLRTPSESLIKEIMDWMDANSSRWLHRNGEGYRIVVLDLWTMQEIVKARWLHLDSTINPVNVDKAWEPLNEYPRVTCEACGNVDDNVLPNEIKISDMVLRSRCEIFRALNGLIVVHERVKDLLLQVVDDQIKVGECQIVNQSGEPIDSYQIKSKAFWIRPKYIVGSYVHNQPNEGHCPKCGEVQFSPSVVEAKLMRNNRSVIDSFGKPKWNIASCGTSSHYRRRSGAPYQTRDIFVSGGLWAYLYNCGVKGLLFPEDNGLFSFKGEPPIEEDRRFSNLQTGKKDKALRIKMWWQKEKL